MMMMMMRRNEDGSWTTMLHNDDVLKLLQLQCCMFVNDVIACASDWVSIATGNVDGKKCLKC